MHYLFSDISHKKSSGRKFRSFANFCSSKDSMRFLLFHCQITREFVSDEASKDGDEGDQMDVLFMLTN